MLSDVTNSFSFAFLQTLNSSQPITVTYSLNLMYNYTHDDMTSSNDNTYSFSQISSDTNYTLPFKIPTLPLKVSVPVNITATLTITQQCETSFSGVEQTATTNSSMILLLFTLVSISYLVFYSIYEDTTYSSLY